MGPRDPAAGDDGPSVTIDQGLAAALDAVEQGAADYVARITLRTHDDLAGALRELDAVTAASDEFSSLRNRRPYFAVRGLGTSSLGVMGQATRFPVVVQVPLARFQATVALVLAAKDEVATPTPMTFEALSSASADLAALDDRDGGGAQG